ALEVRQKLANAVPAAPGYGRAVAGTHYNLALLHEAASRPREAEKAYGEARTLLTKLVEQFPTVADYHRLLGDTLNNLALLLRGRDDLTEARRLLGQAVEHKQAALKPDPRSLPLRRSLCSTYINLAEALQLLGEHGAAIKALLQVPGRLPE